MSTPESFEQLRHIYNERKIGYGIDLLALGALVTAVDAANLRIDAPSLIGVTTLAGTVLATSGLLRRNGL